ncbi:Conserved_hypothetical protein [Hexamita inflata]|uniref:Uncharacterized protein n=1 Tax=Hexamita inflata TaxID=28002 RepID=A0AA86NS49_9EUKA|nr:Conserved hypothetical protein [Hexamita inflata]
MDPKLLNDQNFNAIAVLNQMLKTSKLSDINMNINQLEHSLKLEQQAERKQQQKVLSDALIQTSAVAQKLQNQAKLIEKILKQHSDSQFQTLSLTSHISQFQSIEPRQESEQLKIEFHINQLNQFIHEKKFLASVCYINVLRNIQFDLQLKEELEKSQKSLVHALLSHFNSISRPLQETKINQPFNYVIEGSQLVDQHLLLLLNFLTCEFKNTNQFGVEGAVQDMRRLMQSKLNEFETVFYCLNYFNVVEEFVEAIKIDFTDNLEINLQSIIQQQQRLKLYKQVAQQFNFDTQQRIKLQTALFVQTELKRALQMQKELVFTPKKRKFKLQADFQLLNDVMNTKNVVKEQINAFRNCGHCQDKIFNNFMEELVRETLEIQIMELKELIGQGTVNYYKYDQQNFTVMNQKELDQLNNNFVQAKGCYEVQNEGPRCRFQQIETPDIPDENIDYGMKIIKTKAQTHKYPQFLQNALQIKNNDTSMYVVSLSVFQQKFLESTEIILQLLCPKTIKVFMHFVVQAGMLTLQQQINTNTLTQIITFVTIIMPQIFQKLNDTFRENGEEIEQRFTDGLKIIALGLGKFKKMDQRSVTVQCGSEVAKVVCQ